MHSTPPSLLERLREPGDQDSWRRFVALYTPWIYSWARKAGLRPEDAADLVQDVFTTLFQKLPSFNYDQNKSFRAWLRTVTHNRWKERFRQRATRPLGEELQDIAGPDGTAELEEAEFRRFVVSRAMQVMQADFQPTTWQACWEHVVNDRPAAEVATQFHISVGAVYAARFRVLTRLREELHGMLEG